MKKQIDGQLNLFDYVSKTEKKDRSGIEAEGKESIINDAEGHKDNNISEQKDGKTIISIYKKCISCWCSTCKHNEKGKAVPRDFAGVKKPCPSCDFCIRQKKAEICEIGSYENGCKLRAKEEGIEIT